MQHALHNTLAPITRKYMGANMHVKLHIDVGAHTHCIGLCVCVCVCVCVSPVYSCWPRYLYIRSICELICWMHVCVPLLVCCYESSPSNSFMCLCVCVLAHDPPTLVASLHASYVWRSCIAQWPFYLKHDQCACNKLQCVCRVCVCAFVCVSDYIEWCRIKVHEFCFPISGFFMPPFSVTSSNRAISVFFRVKWVIWVQYRCVVSACMHAFIHAEKAYAYKTRRSHTHMYMY